MYVAADPRSAMRKDAKENKPQLETTAQAGYYNFNESQPHHVQTGIVSWYAQAANFIVEYSKAETDADMSRERQLDEYAIILPDETTRLRVEWNGTNTDVDGYSIVFVPKGASRVSVLNGGQVIRLFTRKAEDIVARCNVLHPGYEGDENVPPLEPWPEPAGGPKVRVYSMDIEQQEGRFGRIFRSTNFMINYIYPRQGPRDRTAVSPHKHDEFQQCSLCLEGEYIHHLRWPWGTNANTWKDDDHERCGAPSVAIIPAVVLHTSEAVGPGVNQLIDIFCPPRADFSAQDGWVLNEDEYPAPKVGNE